MENNLLFHRYAIVDNQDIADAMDMLERSQDEQRQRFEVGRGAEAEAAVATDCLTAKWASERSTRQFFWELCGHITLSLFSPGNSGGPLLDMSNHVVNHGSNQLFSIS